MFKSARWRTDKNKISVPFKLSFHATQVARLGGNALVLSVVPADSGRPTAKLEKSEIRDGSCYWETPIFETVKFIQDPKTGKIHERIYYFILSRGSSKSNILGEVSVNIADYAGAIKAASVSLPLKGLNSDVLLHVLIQRIQESANQRELEDGGGTILRLEDKNLKRHLSNGDVEESININSNDEEPLRKTVSSSAELNGNRSASIGSDITLSSSDSSSGLNTPQELGMKSNGMLLDPNGPNQMRTRWNLLLPPTHDPSTDDSKNSPGDAFSNGRSRLALDDFDTVEKLKSDLDHLSRKAELADMELQTLRKQIVKESKRGQELLKEVTSLKGERDAYRDECEKLKSSQKGKDELKTRNRLSFEGDPWALLEETRQELNHEKDMNTNLRLQLQKTQESNSELLLAVQDLEQILEQSKDGNLDLFANPTSRKVTEVLGERGVERQDLSDDDDDDDEEQKALEEIVKQHTDAKETYILEQKIMDLCNEIEMYRRDKDELEMQVEQLALDYEILKQENHDMSHKLNQSHQQEKLKLQYECSGSYAIINELENRIRKLERELAERSNELSVSVTTTKQLENHIHNLKGELENQAQGFKAEMEAATCAKIEEERQAVQAEEAQNLAKLVELENHIKMLAGVVKEKSNDCSDALSTIKELECQIRSLEEELDQQAQGFESDLEAVTHAKVEQEQRAIRAEEALRLTKWKNANTAGRIQDEFRRLSTQVHSTFEANEKAAAKAMTEASELRLINRHLEDLLGQAKEELQLVKDDYEVQMNDLHDQLFLKSKQIDQMLLDLEEKSNQLNQREEEAEAFQNLSVELKAHKTEIDMISSEIASLTAQIEQEADLKAELEQVKALVKERESLSQEVRRERESLECAVNSAKREAEQSLMELNALKLKNENDVALSNLHSEVEILRARCGELRDSLQEDESEKEKLRNQVTQLKDELRMKDEALMAMERFQKDNNSHASTAESTKEASANSMAELTQHNTLKGQIKLLEGPIKEKETALETSGNAFLEKEKDLHAKIKELEERLEVVNQCREMQVDGNTAVGDGNERSLNQTDCEDQHDLHSLLSEMASLRKKNASKETELVEMQDKYSEISLRFAEVEGERQKLVMKLRSMKKR